MSTEDEDPGEQWRLLRSGGHEPSELSVPTRPSRVTAPDGPARYALGGNGEPRLLIPVPDSARLPEFPKAAALRVLDASLSSKRGTHRFLDIWCLRGELESVFSEVAHEVLRRIHSGSRASTAVRQTLEDFRNLFVLQPRGQPSEKQIRGLVGELLQLRSVLERSRFAWRLWRGPLGDRHDFRANELSMEVKTSARAVGAALTINGLEQLQAPSGGRLVLLHIALETVQGGTLNVESLAAETTELADQPEEVRALIAASGCDHPGDPEWNRFAFRQESRACYRVEAGFPRIVASDFSNGAAPQGVLSVTYDIDLGNAAEFRMTDEARCSYEEALVSCL